MSNTKGLFPANSHSSCSNTLDLCEILFKDVILVLDYESEFGVKEIFMQSWKPEFMVR